jgi:branched-chain amino acid transport system permease protein
MISLCQITFAGIGAITAAHLAGSMHWPVLLAILGGAAVAIPAGLIVGLVGSVLGDIYFALMTLAFGLLVENFVFSLNVFSNYGGGVLLNHPSFAQSDLVYCYFVLIIFALLAGVITNLRRSTPGLAAAAMRSSLTAARASGVHVFRYRVGLTVGAAFVAAIGGTLLSIGQGNANPASFSTLSGLIWVAVIVTCGTRSSLAAATAGIALGVVSAVFTTYLPVSMAEVPTVLFGLGAIMVVRNPDGILALHSRQAHQLYRYFRSPGASRRLRPSTKPGAAAVDSAAVVESDPALESPWMDLPTNGRVSP